MMYKTVSLFAAIMLGISILANSYAMDSSVSLPELHFYKGDQLLNSRMMTNREFELWSELQIRAHEMKKIELPIADISTDMAHQSIRIAQMGTELAFASLNGSDDLTDLEIKIEELSHSLASQAELIEIDADNLADLAGSVEQAASAFEDELQTTGQPAFYDRIKIESSGMTQESEIYRSKSSHYHLLSSDA